jgi:hypothetical protein
MKKTAALLAGVIVPLVAGMGIATSSNAQSATNDEAYCVSLVNEYTHGGTERGFSPESLATAQLGRLSACLASASPAPGSSREPENQTNVWRIHAQTRLYCVPSI